MRARTESRDMRKICVVTNSRADYSRLKTLLESLKSRDDVKVQLFVIGPHLLTSYGMTVDEIEYDGFEITYKMHTEIDGRVPVTMAKSTGAALTELANAFYNFKPDIVVVHGDRYETLAAAVAASLMNITVAHIQGGEVSGTIDEHIRHAVTKLSHLHFPSTEAAGRRIIAMGESPEKVFVTGCPASDMLIRMRPMTFDKLKKKILSLATKKEWKKKFSKDFFLFVYHPVTTEYDSLEKQFTKALAALKQFPQSLMVLWPNIDAGSERLVQALKKFEREEGARVGIFHNFPLETYAQILNHARVVVGNSSSGIREACYFGTPVVNIGSRQRGREHSNNVIDVANDTQAIVAAIKKQLKHGKYEPDYLYGDGHSGARIAEILATVEIGDVQKRITL